jgi:hypothetical protein
VAHTSVNPYLSEQTTPFDSSTLTRIGALLEKLAAFGDFPKDSAMFVARVTVLMFHYSMSATISMEISRVNLLAKTSSN